MREIERPHIQERQEYREEVHGEEYQIYLKPKDPSDLRYVREVYYRPGKNRGTTFTLYDEGKVVITLDPPQAYGGDGEIFHRFGNLGMLRKALATLETGVLPQRPEGTGNEQLPK